MRIAMLSADYLPNIGGVANHIHCLSQAILRQGHEVTVVQPLPARANKPEPEQIDGVTRLIVPWSAGSGRVRRLTSKTRATLGALEWDAFDVLHQHDYRSSVLAATLISRRGPAYIFTNHTSDFLLNSMSRRQTLADRCAWNWVDRIIAPSRELLEASQRAFPRRQVCEIPNGVDLQAFPFRASRLDRDDFVILCPRRMDPKNGVLYLARGARALPPPQNHKRWVLRFLGNSPAMNVHSDYVAEVVACLTDLPPWVEVEMLGNIPHARMPELYLEADVVVIPSVIEAISLAALEAMSSGVPVVASNVGGLAELLTMDETGLLTAPGSPREIAHSLEALERAPELQRTLASNARSLVESSYSWDRIADLTLDLYQSVKSNR